MTAEAFRALDKTEQQMVILRCGIYLMSRMETHSTLFLFQLDSFYVEMQCEINRDTHFYIRCFEDTDQLSPYLQQIQIPVSFY